MSDWYLKNIPKIAHFYWDQECLPFLRYLTILTFSRLNPDWEIKLWQPFHLKEDVVITWETFEHKFYKKPSKNYREKLSDIPNLTINCMNAAERITNILSGIALSDLLRWNILSTEGGMWSDLDIVYLKPITEISSNKKQYENIICIVCRENYIFDTNLIGVLFSSPGNEFFGKALESASLNFDPLKYQSMGTISFDKVFTKEFIYFNRYYINNMNFSDFYNFNPNPNEIEMLYSDKSQKTFDRSVGVHWYAGYPKASEATYYYDENNYMNYNTTMSKIIKLALDNISHGTS